MIAAARVALLLSALLFRYRRLDVSTASTELPAGRRAYDSNVQIAGENVRRTTLIITAVRVHK